MELFAGCRVATENVQRAGYSGTSVDIEDYKRYGYAVGEGTAFDILSQSGFPFLGPLRAG